MRSDRYIEERAARLLSECGEEEAPVSVRRLAKHCGARVRKEPSDSGVSAALYREGDLVIIGVNANHPQVRRRFSVAHELGHLVLHSERFYVDHEFRRDAVSSQATDPFEIEANKFAAALLMPQHFLERDLEDLNLPVRSEDVGELASRYEVSQQAMVFRLQNLRVPLDQT